MAKLKHKSLATRDGQGASFAQEASYDDTLLPDAAELQKLQQLDPNILEWIKSRTEKEQDMRHEFTRRKLSLVESGQTRGYRVDVLSIICAFVILMVGMGLSALLLWNGQVLGGGIFAGVTLLFAAKAFLNFRRPESKPEGKEKK